MTVSSLLITLDSRSQSPDKTIAQLSVLETLDLGPVNGLFLPAVLDTLDPRHSRDAVTQLEDLPGIAKVEVLSIFFDEDVDS